jgi:predicted HTH transcriptional regulator
LNESLLSPKKVYAADLGIADLFFRLHKVERIGMGIRKMKETMLVAGLREPIFEPDGFFRVIFHRSPELAMKEAMPGAADTGKRVEVKTTPQTALQTAQKTVQKEEVMRDPSVIIDTLGQPEIHTRTVVLLWTP